jgi:hypothetical protein
VLLCTLLAAAALAVAHWPTIAEQGANLGMVAGADVGTLTITSDLPESVVFVDGVEHGAPPVTLHGLARGRHQVTVRSLHATSEQIVDLDGTPHTLAVVGSTALSPPWGWLSASDTAAALEGNGLAALGTR